MKKIKFEIETIVKVAEKDTSWIWMDAGNIGACEVDGEKYQVMFTGDLHLRTPDGKVIVKVVLDDVIGEMIKIAKSTRRNK